MKTVILQARVTPELIDRLDAVVSQNTGDRSDHIRQAIVEYIQRHEPNHEDAAEHRQ